MRLAILYSPVLKTWLINSAGPVENVRMLLSDLQANAGLEGSQAYEGVVVIRLPRRFHYDRWTNKISDKYCPRGCRYAYPGGD